MEGLCESQVLCLHFQHLQCLEDQVASPQWLSELGTLFHAAIVLGMEAVSTLQHWTVCLVGGLTCQDAFRLKYL